MKVTRPKLEELQKQGIGVLASGAYIRSTFDDAELREIAGRDFATVEWKPMPELITIRSDTRGAQARFGLVSTDGKWLQYPTFPVSHGSVACFHAEPEAIAAFIGRQLNDGSRIWRVRKYGATTTPKTGVGLLISREDKSPHNALLCCVGDTLYLIGFELSPPSHAVHEQGSVVPATEADAAVARQELRAAVGRLSAAPAPFKNTCVPLCAS